jgi:gliding motility-associated-like protein
LDYGYDWTTGDETAFVEDLPAGDYGVLVTDGNECTVLGSITLNEPTLIIAAIDWTDELCVNSEDGTADLEVVGGIPPYDFAWDVGDSTITDEDLIGLGEGMYYVEITDGNGCSLIDSIEILSPINFEAGPDTNLVFCSGDGIINLSTFLLATAPGEWVELTSSEQFNPLTAELDLTDLPEGDYVFNFIIPVYTPCTDTLAEFRVRVNPLPDVNFTADEVVGCAPMAIIFSHFYDMTGAFCVWDMGDGTIIEDCGPVNHYYEYPGDYDVTLEVISELGCSNSFTAEGFIHVYDNPEAAFSYAPDFPSVQDPEVEFINNSIDAITYDWNFGDGSANSNFENPYHLFPNTPNEDYLVRLIVTDENGCVDTAVQHILIEDVLIFYVPNAFTPDGDQYNGTFKPVMTSGYNIHEYHLMIFDRWGEVVFESMNADYGWDGTYGNRGLAQDGVYIWTLEFAENMSSSKKHAVEGHVTLLK